MKKLVVGALVAGAVACQAPEISNAPMAKAGEFPTDAQLAQDSTAAMLRVLRQVDLAPAWGNATPETKEHGALEGYYGPDNYRMSFYYDRVRQDARQPNVFHVWGRDRYKKTITPFTATLTVTRLAPVPDTVGMTYAMPKPVRAYTAFATFVLREATTAKGAGHCQGRAALDFYLDQQGRAEQLPFDAGVIGLGNPTKSSGLLFQGTWQDNQTGRQQPVAWANFYWVILPKSLEKLGLGMRMEEVNPKLARYGWNTIMENDEWWATTPKPSLSL